MEQFQKASANISVPGLDTGEYHVGFLHEWNDIPKIYAENAARLIEMKGKYDPCNRFDKGVDLVQGKVGEDMFV